MMNVRTISRLVGVLALSVAASAWVGCSSTPENEKASGSTKTNSEFREAPVPEGSGGQSMGNKLAGFQTVYFDYDKSDIREDARASLRQNADKLNAGSYGVVTIEGHCDERGSSEYNLALGERRANAVKRYLVDLGVPSKNLRTVSFGSERPAVQGHDESAWRYNRRADFTK
jgi:peptidoglycan-associated lipoprotein